MDIKDLDFKELLQKPAEKPVSTRYLEGQLSNQELETVVGGVRAVEVRQKLLVLSQVKSNPDQMYMAIKALYKEGKQQEHEGHQMCVPDPNNPPDYIMCVNRAKSGFDKRSR